ncbi:MAG: glutamate 5-kinase [Candidatus Nanopelagicaceae bacterium]|nr:glutamate 5-kinase [Candidatus Nanopelagicaceae bacterium]
MSSREELRAPKRVVIKIGSSSLTGVDAAGLKSDAVDALVDVVANLKKSGSEVVIVSSGAIAAGLAPLGLTARPKDLATQQAAASVGQGLLVHRYTESLARYSIVGSQVLLTIDDVVRRSHYQNAQRTLNKLLQLGVVPIINENDSVGTQEIRFGDNDRIAALVSHLIGADLLILVTDVDALYDAPPSQSGAKPIHEVEDISVLSGAEIGGTNSKVGSGGMVTKIEAARIATGAGIPLLLTSLAKVSDAIKGEKVGTLFKAVRERQPSRLLWLAHAATPLGKLHVDEGAAKALRERGVSLLPAGTTKVMGDFSAGDTVEIVAPDGSVIARGLVGFDASEIPAMLGRSTKELGRDLGPEFERELVHRDDLVLL